MSTHLRTILPRAATALATALTFTAASAVTAPPEEKQIPSALIPIYADVQTKGTICTDVPDPSSYYACSFEEDGKKFTIIGGGATSVEIRDADELEALAKEKGITLTEAMILTDGTEADIAPKSVRKQAGYVQGFQADGTDTLKTRMQFGFNIDTDTVNVAIDGQNIGGFAVEDSGYTVKFDATPEVLEKALLQGNSITAFARSEKAADDTEHYVFYTFENSVDLTETWDANVKALTDLDIHASPEITLNYNETSIDASPEQRAAIAAGMCLAEEDIAGAAIHEVSTTTGINYPFAHVFVFSDGTVLGSDLYKKEPGKKPVVSASIVNNAIENHTISTCAGSYKQEYQTVGDNGLNQYNVFDNIDSDSDNTTNGVRLGGTYPGGGGGFGGGGYGSGDTTENPFTDINNLFVNIDKDPKHKFNPPTPAPVAPVPLPAGLALLGGAVVALGAWGKMRGKNDLSASETKKPQAGNVGITLHGRDLSDGINPIFGFYAGNSANKPTVPLQVIDGGKQGHEAPNVAPALAPTLELEAI